MCLDVKKANKSKSNYITIVTCGTQRRTYNLSPSTTFSAISEKLHPYLVKKRMEKDGKKMQDAYLLFIGKTPSNYQLPTTYS